MTRGAIHFAMLMTSTFKINCHKISIGELVRGSSNPLNTLLVVPMQLLRVKIPTFTDIAAVEDFGDYEVPCEQLSQTSRDQMAASITELEALGFTSCLCHQVLDTTNRTTLEMVHMLHDSGQVFARVQCTAVHLLVPAKRKFFVTFYSHYADGQTLGTTNLARDWNDAPSLDVAYCPKSTPSDLWQRHQQRIAARQTTPIVEADGPDALRDQLTLIQGAVVDDLLDRGIFERMEPGEVGACLPLPPQSLASDPQISDEASDAVPQSSVMPTYDPDYLSISGHIDASAKKVQNTQSMLLILLVSIALFFGLGATAWSTRFVLMLIPILLFHELGHWVAMKIYRYRNMKMFFIPMLGAAVTGEQYNVAGWKKIIVYLAGPLPGIVFGSILGVAGLIRNNEIMTEMGNLMLIINAFNLLPIFPLDGGRVMHQILFSRHPILQVIFQGLAAFSFFALYLLTDARLLMFLAIIMAVNIVNIWKVAQATEDLKKQELDLKPVETGCVIPPATLSAILNRLKQAFTRPVGVKAMSMHCLNIYEALASSRPGVLSSIFFSFLQFGSLAASVVIMAVILANQQGILTSGFFDMAAKAPQTLYLAGDTQWMDRADEQAIQQSRATLIGLADDEAKASRIYDMIIAKLPDKATASRFGRIVLLEMDQQQTSERNTWFDLFEEHSLSPQVQTEDRPVPIKLSAMTASLEKAEEIENLLCAWGVSNQDVIMPGNPNYQITEQHRKARYTYRLLLNVEDEDEFSEDEDDEALGKIYQEMERISEEMTRVMRRGDTQAMEVLSKKSEVLSKQVQNMRLDQIRALGSDKIDLQVIELYTRKPDLAMNAGDTEEKFDSWREKIKVYNQQLFELMGTFPKDDVQAKRYAYQVGVYRQSLMINLGYATFNSPAVGLPSLVKWLESQGCIQIRYDLFPSE